MSFFKSVCFTILGSKNVMREPCFFLLLCATAKVLQILSVGPGTAAGDNKIQQVEFPISTGVVAIQTQIQQVTFLFCIGGGPTNENTDKAS